MKAVIRGAGVLVGANGTLCDHKAGGFPLPGQEPEGCAGACAGEQSLHGAVCSAWGLVTWGPGWWHRESPVCRRLGTAGTALRGPCVCSQLAGARHRGCLSPRPGQGGGWVGASRAPSLPRQGARLWGWEEVGDRAPWMAPCPQTPPALGWTRG